MRSGRFTLLVATMRIERIALQHVGPFDHLDLTFPKVRDDSHAEIHIFTGPNGSGKSTLLYALACLWSFVDASLISKRFRHSSLHTHPEVRLQYDDGFQLVYAPSDIDVDKNTFNWNRKQQGRRINWFWNLNQVSGISDYLEKSIRYDANDRTSLKSFDFALFGYGGTRSIRPGQLPSIKELTDNPFEKSLSFLNSTDSQKLVQWIANTIAKEAITYKRGERVAAESYITTLKNIEDAVSRITEKPVSFILETEPLNVRVNYEGSVCDFDGLPDGVQSILSWIADLLMRADRIRWSTSGSVLEKNYILFLDEIDIHLHPAWQRRILPVVQDLFPNAQIFVSTHSPFVVGSIDDAWVHRLDFVDGNATVVATEEAKAGSSVSLVLEEVFGIQEQFDIETEEALDTFYVELDRVLKGEEQRLEHLLSLARSLSERGLEVHDIVARELRQLERHTVRTLDV